MQHKVDINYRFTCHDCGVREGQIHKLNCDMESCPFCGNQLMSCDCCYEKLKLDCSEGTWTYENGLTDKEEAQWLDMLTRRGRVPYFQTIVRCYRCGCHINHTQLHKWMVSDKEWRAVVPIDWQNEVLCFDCFNWIKRIREQEDTLDGY